MTLHESYSETSRNGWLQAYGNTCAYFNSRTMVASSKPFDDPSRYRSLVGSLQYLTVTHPDISYVVNQLCQHMHSPTFKHWSQLKHVLCYVKGTIDYGLHFRKSCISDLHSFSNSNWVGCPTDRKSMIGFAIFLGTNLVPWVCKKHKTIAKSSTEVEYKALADVAANVTWIVSLLRELGMKSLPVPKLWCENSGATYMCANPIFHARTKHIEINYHFVWDKVATGELQVNFVTKDQLVDIFTKPMPAPRFTFLCDKLQVINSPPWDWEEVLGLYES